MPNTNSYRWQEDRDPLWAADAIEEAILFEGPETVAAVILEPVQNGGGCFVPQDGYFQRVREICDRHGVLLISDEVICSWGRLGHWFGCERFGYQPDMITTAKGITSAYAPLGAVIAADHIAEPFLHGKAIFNHGFTFGGHPVACAVGAGEHRRDRARGAVRARARQRRSRCARCSRACATCRSSATCAAPATSTRSSWSRTRTPRRRSTHEESEELLRGFLSGELYRRGLICRTDDRGDPIVQLSPPLIAGQEQFEEIEAILRPVLSEASERIVRASGAHGREPDRRAGARARPAATSRPTRSVRWVHSTELLDPTPWLNGGELLLTTGIQLNGAEAQRELIERLADHEIAGLGFGTGFTHKRLPAALVTAARKRTFPLFEVPYELPFIAITERAFAQLSTSATKCCSATWPATCSRRR